MTPDDDWRRFRASGDAAALGAVFDAVSPELFRVALALAPDAASAEDALQETWLVALASADRHDPARPLVPWLVGILRRKVHEGRRAARRPDERRVAKRASPTDPAVSAESAEELAHLRAAIDELPAAYREIAVLRWRYGLEPGEIADARGMAPGTVRSLLHRALLRLRRSLRVAPALLVGARWPRGLGDVRRTVLRAATRRSATSATLTTAGGILMAKATKTAVVALAACLLLGAGAIVELSGKRTPTTAVPNSTPPDAARVAASRARPAVTTATANADDAAATAKPFARGIVVDEADAPVSGCRVLVRGHESVFEGEVQDAPLDPAASAAAVTAADGRFDVRDRPTDLVSLTFLADGFEAAEVREPSANADLRVTLARGGSFAARVTDTEGRPIADASAFVSSGPAGMDGGRVTLASRVWMRARTDAAGRFAFRSLPPQAQLNSITAKGYELPEGKLTSSLPERDVYVMERAALLVDVTDATTHATIVDARGVLVRADGSILGPLSRHDDLTMTGAPRGRIFWYVRPRGGDDVRAELRVFAPGHRTSARPVTWPIAGEPPHLAVELEPGDEPPAISGRVVGGAGGVVDVRAAPDPAANPEFAQPDSMLTSAARATVADDGSFAVGGIPRGRYRLTVLRAGTPPAWRDVEAPTSGVEIALPAAASLDVRYSDTSGRPVAGAWMHVCTTDRHWWWDLRTDAEGRARFDALPAAEVDVLPAARSNWGGLAQNQPIPGERRTLAAGTTTRVDLVQPDRCRVTVVVRDDSGRPVPQAELHVAAQRGLAFADRAERERLPTLDLATDADGRATFDVLPCRGEVKALRQGRVNSAKFIAETGSSPTVEIVLPNVTGTIRGRVLDRGTGAPVAGRPVTVWWDHKTIAHAVTGDDGRFVASGVPAGHVNVSVAGLTDANDPEQRRVDPKSPYRYADVEFEMAAGEDRTIADIAMPRVRGGDAERAVTVVDVTVVDVAGAPVAKAWVQVTGRIAGAWCSVAADSSAQTGDDGRVRLEVIAAERYRVGASAGERRADVERDPAAALVERIVLPAK